MESRKRKSEKRGMNFRRNRKRKDIDSGKESKRKKLIQERRG
jgi:hypothetical protein